MMVHEPHTAMEQHAATNGVQSEETVPKPFVEYVGTSKVPSASPLNTNGLNEANNSPVLLEQLAEVGRNISHRLVSEPVEGDQLSLRGKIQETSDSVVPSSGFVLQEQSVEQEVVIAEQLAREQGGLQGHMSEQVCPVDDGQVPSGGYVLQEQSVEQKVVVSELGAEEAGGIQGHTFEQVCPVDDGQVLERAGPVQRLDSQQVCTESQNVPQDQTLEQVCPVGRFELKQMSVVEEDSPEGEVSEQVCPIGSFDLQEMEEIRQDQSSEQVCPVGRFQPVEIPSGLEEHVCSIGSFQTEDLLTGREDERSERVCSIGSFQTEDLLTTGEDERSERVCSIGSFQTEDLLTTGEDERSERVCSIGSFQTEDMLTEREDERSEQVCPEHQEMSTDQEGEGQGQCHDQVCPVGMLESSLRVVLQEQSTEEGKGKLSAVPSIVLEEPRDKLQLKLPPVTEAVAAGVSSARKSPVTVQEWVDSLPAPLHRSEDDSEEPPVDDADDVLDLGLGAEAGLLYDSACPSVTIIRPQTTPEPKVKSLVREPSVQSDNSHGSSVESYLESRKPDPEEVLMSLGFGGHVSAMDSEVSRIPRRFLQPSKVKGVAIEDFLRYQQDLIETFETGFCGYHGLSGSSDSMPSVIVAKIMEKLREHERESCTSAGTSDRASPAASPPPETGGKRFSSVARRVLKRTNVLGAIPSRQPATLSVLNADNRRFLESQGAKSPEVPRKRMVIGHRSYTVGCDGEMIEVTKPKPLVHKDSVLSSATSLSLTSVDSDSDTDERSDSYELHRHVRVPLVPDSSTETVQPHQPVGKRMSSTSLSSWESDPASPESPLPRGRSHRSRFYLPSSSPDMQTRYESIDEDVEMKAGSDTEKAADSVFRAESEDGISRRGSLKRQPHISEEETHLNVATNLQADSFEMEEIGMAEEDQNHVPLSRARSDSSGFLEGDSESRDADMARLRGGDATAKRPSLPIVRVHDEQGSLLVTRSCSLHSLGSSTGSTCGRPRRRTQSVPNGLSLGGSWSSVSNMFSSCSDESVIHTGVGAPSTELQELLHELAGRGLSLSPSPAQSPRCAYKDEAEAVRLALGAYSSQLAGGTSSLDILDRGPPEARRELHAVREIRGQIATELRHVATLLEEQPGPRAAAITRQMTALLREQTRLCHQLESLSHGSSELELPAICCNSERLLGALREENRRLERLVESHSQELTEIRQLLQELVTRRS